MDAHLEQLFDRLPDPEAARRFHSRLEREQPQRLRRLARKPALLANLLTLAAYSPWMADVMLLEPEVVDFLDRVDLSRMFAKEDLLEELARFAFRHSGVDERAVLVAFKRRELARIYLRDCLKLAALSEVTEELSHLADAILERALAHVRQDLVNRHGMPQTRDARGRIVEAELAVVALGKLGSLELNYASDIDLMFLYSGRGQTALTSRGTAGEPVDNHTFFRRLAESLVKLVGSPGQSAPVYRIDLRLRPYGRDGDVAVRDETAVEYYRTRAQNWERQMLIRARAAAGSEALVARFLASVRDEVFRPEPLPEFIASVRAAKEKIDRDERGRAGGFNVKLGPGGIREIEFIAQALQITYGGQDRWLRAPRLLIGLQRLADKGLIGDADRAALSDAYTFLRTVEHRLQMQHGVQTHRLPTEAESLATLGRRCGFEPAAGDPGEQLRAEIERHVSRVRAIYERVLAPGQAGPQTPGPDPALRVVDVDEADLAAHPLEEAARKLAVILGSSRAEAGGREESGRGRQDGDRANSDVRSTDVRLQLADLASKLPRPARALRNLDLYLASLATLPVEAQGEALAGGASKLEALLSVLGSGKYFSEILLRQPVLAADLPRPLFCTVPRTRAEYEAELGEALEGEVLSDRMARLRRVWYRKMIAIACNDVLAGLPLAVINRTQTDLAEASLDVACRIALAELAPDDGPPPRFSIQALGRLGHAGMDYGSDLDIVVLFDREAPAPSAELDPSRFYIALAELVVRVLSALTREGSCYRVDLRLRPEGRNGRLASSLPRVVEYLHTRASAWELTAYLKLRPAAGNVEFGQGARAEVIRAVFEGRARHPDLRGELRAMRLRLERERGRRGVNVKWGAGGMMDVYFVTRYLQLRDAIDFSPERGTGALVMHLGGLGALGAEEARALGDGYALLRRVDHALRLIGDRSDPRVPEEADLREELALATGFASVEAFDEEVSEAMAGIRGAFERTFS